MRSGIASIEPDAKWGATFIEIRKKGLVEMNKTPEERERLDKSYQKVLDGIVAAHYPEKLNKTGVYQQTSEQCDCHPDQIRLSQHFPATWWSLSRH